MELQTTGDRNGIANRDSLAKFVHDLADMEVRAFTMRETSKRIRMDAIRKKQQLEVECRDRKDGFDRINDILRTAKDKKREAMEKKLNETKKLKTYWVKYLFAALGIGILAGLFVCGAIYQNMSWDAEMGIFMLVCLYIPCSIVYLFLILKGIKHVRDAKHTILQRISELTNEFNMFTTQIDTLEKKRSTANQSFFSAQNKLSEFEHNEIPVLFDRADSLEKDVKLIEERIRQCYELDIVKPSYRKLVCMVILDEIFINDKADTMREAMLLCDTELRHSELIGKLDEVIDALQTLAVSLQHMSNILDSININISIISQDIYKMTESQERIAYAAESVKKSADNVDTYIYQKRVGLI